MGADVTNNETSAVSVPSSGWLVKDFADGWFPCTSRAELQQYIDQGHAIKPSLDDSTQGVK